MTMAFVGTAIYAVAIARVVWLSTSNIWLRPLMVMIAWIILAALCYGSRTLRITH